MTDNYLATAGGDAAIYEQGYRSYDGERTGVTGAVRTLVVHSIRAVLGIGRSARHKIMPVVVIAMAYIPAAVFVGVAALLPGDLEDGFLPSYAGYYGYMSAALFLFASFVAPELLCTDRRTGMLGVYLASPLDRRTYLLGKTLAVASILALVTIGPPLLLLIALTLTDAGPGGFGGFVSTAGRILLAGAVMSAIFAAVSMAVSAATDRKAAATASIIGVLIGSTAVTSAVVDGGGQSELWRLADLASLPSELAARIHGEEGEWASRDISTGLMWLVFLAVVGVAATWVWYRYRRMLVRR